MRNIGKIYCTKIASEFNLDGHLILKILNDMKEKIAKDNDFKMQIKEVTIFYMEKYCNNTTNNNF